MCEKEQVIENLETEDVISNENETTDEPTLPEYLIAESIRDKTGNTVSIMNLQLNDLIFEKLYLLFEKLRISENDYETAKVDLQVARDKLLTETDFSEVLGKTRTNKEEREAYMKPFLADFENKVNDENKNTIFYKDKLNIINDLIKKERLLLQIEGDLKY